MSTQQPKPASYIAVTADVNFLQRIICCNHNIGNAPGVETPKAETLKVEPPKEDVPEVDFAIEVPLSLEIDKP